MTVRTNEEARIERESKTVDTQKAFIEKINQAIKACGLIGKDAHNDNQDYDYASITAVAGAGRKALADNGLVLLPGRTIWREDVVAESRSGAPLYITRLRREFVLTDGVVARVFEMDGDGISTSDKAIYKALTGTRKYALQFVLQMEIGDDAEQDTPETHSAGTTKKPSGTILKFGSAKGKDISEVDGKSLGWYRGVLAQSIVDPEKRRFRKANEELLNAINAEIKHRQDLAKEGPQTVTGKIDKIYDMSDGIALYIEGDDTGYRTLVKEDIAKLKNWKENGEIVRLTVQDGNITAITLDDIPF